MDDKTDFFPGDFETVDPHLTERMESVSLRRAVRMAEIRSRYLITKRDKLIETELKLLIEGAAVSVDGHQSERRCLALLGETGAGKSASIERAIRQRPEFEPRQTGMTETRPIIRVKAPQPSTLKLMAEKILEKLGYPLKRELKEAQAWSIVRRQLQVRRVRFVHIDEAQHLLNLSDHDAMVRLSDALKMVMEDDEWPVSLVLTGLPKLADFLTIYSQLRRRSHTVHLETLTLPRDAELLRWIATQIVENHAGMAFGFNPDEDFLGRLCHAAGRQFGAVTQIVRGAIERVLIDDIDGREVKQIHFARAYELFSGCRPDQNIMSARAWQEIEPLNALLREEEVARIRAIEEAAQRSTKHGGNRRTGHKKRKGA